MISNNDKHFDPLHSYEDSTIEDDDGEYTEEELDVMTEEADDDYDDEELDDEDDDED